MTVTVHDVLGELRSASWDERDKGDRFERLIAAYLHTDPLYVQKYDEVWRWSDWPGRDGRPDTGIDLVAQACHRRTVRNPVQVLRSDPHAAQGRHRLVFHGLWQGGIHQPADRLHD